MKKTITLLAMASLAGACLAATGAGPGTLSGQILDTNGKPVAGAKVRVEGAVTVGDAEVRTGSDGRYKFTGLPGVPYKVYAWKKVDYRDDNYCLRLGHPSLSDYDAINPKDGAVRNFRWQLTGEIPDRDGAQDYGGGFFGGAVSLLRGDGLNVGDIIELRFEPNGKLIDGSTGKVITRRVKLKRDGTYALDVPVGPYSVTATVADSKAPLAIGREWGKYAAKTSLEFESSGDCSYESGVKSTNLYVARTSAAAAPAPTASVPQVSAASFVFAGSISVPKGQNSEGVIVFACPVNGGCESDESRTITAVAGAFRINGLSAQTYQVFAWKDMDGDGRVSDGDLLGAYTTDGENVAALTPPAANLKLELSIYES